MSMKIFVFLFKFNRFVPWGPIDNKSALVQVMAWYRMGEEPFPGPVMAKYEAIWHQ